MLRQLIPGRSERLFARFRSRGDAAALGSVFDRTAPELFGLALRLAPGPELAQDLVQATYLAAIESAGKWDARRPLVPWLVGILVREARMMRRRERRGLDRERLEPRPDPDPSCLAQDDEFARALESALEVLPDKYREVLHAHLYAEKPAAEIAAELGREPGTVRVQIHRGLELLRKTLPAGFALGAALVISPRVQAGVRERVLARAAEGAGAIGPALAGGIAMKKVSLAALALVAVGGAVWLARAPRERSPDVASQDGEALAAAPDETRAVPVARVLAGTDAPAPRESLTPEASEAAVLAPGRAGIQGRVVEQDGTPVPGMPVALTEIPPELFVLDAIGALEDEPRERRLHSASAVTDAQGRFTLRDAHAGAVHALGLDLGGPRATLRVLEDALHPDETTDLGDVVLAASGALVGRVVDEAGRPRAGVRVRAARLPEVVLELELHRLRPSSLLVARGRRSEAPRVVEITPLAFELLERLPIPTATTGEDGTFALRAPLGDGLTLAADAPGFEPCLLPDVRLLSGATRDVGALTLRAGRTLVCRVRDAAGVELDGAEVFAGTLDQRGRLAVCERAEPAGEPGLYRRAGATAGPAVFAVRTAGGPWSVAGPFEGAGVQDVRLGELRTLTLETQDGRGEGVRNLRLAFQSSEPLARAEETAFLAPARSVEAVPVPRDATRYLVSGLAEGHHVLFARADGCAPLRCEIDVRGEAPLVRLAFQPSSTLRVRVLDAATGTALAGVEVSALVGRQGRHTRVASTRSDGEGRACLDRFATTSMDELLVRAEHEGFAAAGARVEDEGELELRLERPAVVVGRVLEGGRPPARRYVAALQPLDASLRKPFNLPFHALTDSAGNFRISGVPPGKTLYQVGERFLEGDPLMDLLGGRMGQSFDADKGILERRVQEGALDLAAGAVARLEIELAPGGPSSAALRGRLVRDGRGWPGMEVELRAGRLEVVRRTDERGAFDFGRVSAGEVRLKVEDVARGRTVLRGDLELAEGEERVLELSFDPLTLDLCLTGAPGPVADAELVLSPRSALYSSEPIAARTGGAGCCRVTLPGCGSYSWSAEAGGAKASGEVHVLSGDPLVLAFRPRVSLAGTLVLAPELLAAPQFSLLSVRSLAEDGRTEFSTLDPSRSEAEFRLELDGAGRYELQAMCGERRSRPIVIDVPAAGLTDQRLSFEIDLTVDRAR